MDETTHSLVLQTLERLTQQRDQLDKVIASLNVLLGEDAGGPADAAALVGPVLGGQGLDVRPGEFFGKPASRAALILLRRIGSPERPHPLTTEELHAAITKGGAESASPRRLYTSLFKDQRFRRVGKGLWGLAAWYPDLPKTTKSAGDDAAASPPEPEASEPASKTEDQASVGG